jgi:hypothetical protein
MQIKGVELRRELPADYSLRITQTKKPGRSAEGPRHPGYFLPASAVSEQGIRTANFSKLRWLLLLLFATPEEFVAFDGCHHADGTLVARFGTLYST